MALVLRILGNEISVAEAARLHALPPEQVSEWQETFLRGAERALSQPTQANATLLSRANPGARDAAAVVVIAAIWLALRVAYWNGYYTEDSPGYVSDAISTAVHGFSARKHVNGLNIGTFLPVAVPIALLGNSEVALSLWPMACSALGVASIGTLSGVLFGRRYGLLAGFLYATYPGDVFFSTVVMPDAIQAGWVSLSMLLIVAAFTGAAGHRAMKVLAAGAALGVCHLVRAGDAMFLPVGVAATALLSHSLSGNGLRRSLRDGACYAGGWAVVVALEGLLYLALTGDPLLRFHVIGSHYGTLDSIGKWGLNHDPRTIPFSLFTPLLWWNVGGWWRLNQDQAYHGLLFCWALLALGGGIVAAVVAKDLPRRVVAGCLVALVWLAWPLLYHQFGSQSLTQFVPIHRLSRQLVAYAPGAIVATVAGLFLANRWVSRWRSRDARQWAVALAAVVAALHLHFNWQGAVISYEAYHRVKDTYVRIREHLPADTTVIVGDPGDLSFFNFWLNPPGTERVRMWPYEGVADCREIQRAVVLTHSNPGWEGFGALAIRTAVARLPCLMTPPERWRLLYGGYPEKVYQVSEVSGLQPSAGLLVEEPQRRIERETEQAGVLADHRG